MIVAICFLVGLCLLLNFVMLHVTHGITACDPGWFGRNCQFQCLCTGSQCDSAGQCMAGSRCKPGYFGPACQYGDIVQLTALTSDTLMWLKDGDDATCSSDPHIQSVALRFHQGLSFTWFRICVSRSDALNRFDIKLNNDVSCVNMKNATVDETSIDVYCSVTKAVRSLTLSGPGVPFLCSVYISLGRNVASREPISHSSINLHGELRTSLLTNEKHQSTRPDNNSHVCSKRVNPESSWIHRFKTPQFVTALVWTKRNDEKSSRINLKMFGTAGQLVHHFLEDNDDHYHFIPRTRPVSQMLINARPNEFLHLCELFIFGETVCPDGTFGLDCGSLCNCTDRRQTCLMGSGQCAAACTNGFYGLSCSVPCPDACRSGLCTPRYGDCIDELRHASVFKRADPGIRKTNKTTSSGCRPGYYGKGCMTPCNQKCNNTCDPVTGGCLRCQPGHYGVNCDKKCQDECFNDMCDADNGFCVECSVDKWGNYCEKVCGERCYLQECNSTTGKCFSCAAGYKGSECNKVPWNVTLFIVLLFLIPSVIACFFCCEVLSDEDAEDDIDKDSADTELTVQPSGSGL